MADKGGECSSKVSYCFATHFYTLYSSVGSSEYVALKFVHPIKITRNKSLSGYQWRPLARHIRASSTSYISLTLLSSTLSMARLQHDVFVTEVVGPSFTALQLDMTSLPPSMGHSHHCLRRELLRQSLVAPDYLHSRSGVHGSESITCLPACPLPRLRQWWIWGIHSGNLAVATPDLRGKSEVAVMEYYQDTDDPEIDKSIPLEFVEILIWK